jgi:hypothetical protein
MDVYSNASSWLQHSPTQVAQPSPVVQNDIADSQRPPNSNDWKDPPPSASGSNGAAAVSGNIDLHDFGLGDLSGKHRVHAPHGFAYCMCYQLSLTLSSATDVLDIPRYPFPLLQLLQQLLPSIRPRHL